VGGGTRPRPGEITLAHQGVLFLDELPELSRDALEALRQPLEEGLVTITRGQHTLTFPARAMLVAACNACPCARPAADCTCSAADFARYDRKVSGPLLDRLDLVCRLGPVAPLELVGASEASEEGSAAFRARVCAAREVQQARLARTGRTCNAAMDARLTRRLVPLEPAARRTLLEGHRVLGLTGRAHDRVVRVARTIADLDRRDRVAAEDVGEALGYRVGPAARLAA
jgi:magnesium chelatase family protein